MLEDIIGERKRIRSDCVAEGVDPYPATVKRNALVDELIAAFTKLEKKKTRVIIAGRIRAARDQGNIIFYDVADESGKMQVLARRDETADFSRAGNTLHTGDFVEVHGAPYRTKRGEKSIAAKRIRLIAKGIRPLPNEWYGLKDAEERFRKRYLDTLFNEDVKRRLVKRNAVIRALRETLWKEGFQEVETPVLQPIPGGALARPFLTHHNALDADFYLRVAPELYLKRLLVGGFEKIFEIGRVFRNEGVDRDHNPEFTMLELYWAYQDYRGMMKFVRALLGPFIPGRWTTIPFADACKTYGGTRFEDIPKNGLDEFFKKNVRPRITTPTYVIDYPEHIMPLAKFKSGEPGLTESFQLIVNGSEVVKGFSEMNDPVVQRQQMEEQERQFRAGNQEASRLDEDFLEALEYGMPPAAGIGIGIDRLVALATKTRTIKEIIIFPTLRPEGITEIH
ncbi:MAG: lysine--tRNA ligase [Candidatus Liptonbacteria bacterium]|nr:lysine--tRNA ligase [Candidatus Liptonbacteria bacterium]